MILVDDLSRICLDLMRSHLNIAYSGPSDAILLNQHQGPHRLHHFVQRMEEVGWDTHSRRRTMRSRTPLLILGPYLRAIAEARALDKQSLQAVRNTELSSNAEELLRVAAIDGTFTLKHVEAIGTWVRVSLDKSWLDCRDTHDPSVAERCLRAFLSLCERRYIDHEGSNFFALTKDGLEKARTLV